MDIAQNLLRITPAGYALAGVSLVTVVAYIGWLLPKLRREAGIAGSVVMASSTVAVSVLLWWQFSLPVGWVVPVVWGLAFGHIGWGLGWRSSQTWMRRQAPAAAAPPSQPSRPSVPAPVPERATLGRYRIERELGRGAMGAVYLGRDPKIGRQVAIKTMALSSEFAGDELIEARERFFREAETAGRLQHPDIVTIFDAGEEQDLAYIAMEYLKGENLQTFTQPGRLLPAASAVEIVARVADALGYAHSQGVVHRDIKPANVMVDPAADAVKVTDFGIARITDSARTRTGMILGTPSFMSPEQIAGRRVDGRSDLYSLGVMLFQLLTGRLPHRGDSMAMLMRQIVNEPAPELSTLRPELPEALGRVLAMALEKKPEARHSTGQQFAAALRACGVQAGETAAPAAAAADVLSSPPDSSGFAKTVKMSRDETGHNSRH